MFNETKIISVIMPIHNITSKQIDGALSINSTVDSFFKQDIVEKELIIVDDASSDNSIQYISELLEKRNTHGDVKLIPISDHRGPGGARNVGLKNAKGKYIFFLDADDLIGKNSLSTLVNKAEKWNSDFVLGQYIALERGYPKEFAKNGDVESADVKGNRLVSSVGPWSKLYKRSVIEKNHLRFTENIFMFEDMAFVMSYISHAKKKSISVNKTPHYILRNHDERQDNLTNKVVTLSDRLRGLRAVLDGISSSDLLKALALDRLFIYPSQSNPFKEKWADKEQQIEYFAKYKQLLLDFDIHSWLHLVPTSSVRVIVQALIENYSLDDIISIGSFSKEYFSNYSLFQTKKNFPSNLMEILFVKETVEYISSIDILSFEVEDVSHVVFKSNISFSDRSIIIIDRDNVNNLYEIPFHANQLMVDMCNISTIKEGKVDIYIKYFYDNVLLRVMFPVEIYKFSENSQFYKNWRNGLTYQYKQK
ncbi:glycosyltransferase family 2 protein [Leuconostoc falkenbergense]|uniref:glycosyltransferase family 2 protein n=1 Tax=Leuconostoc falkenbergense TaxID=2766470 RepID=UPI0024A86BA0|nr:glycosyltransferase family 2 protein [Leuconostoc falkenbergense]MDI6553855.1 glycosyltransferase family 2 protein [Leuconostoc falkenbergense]